MLARCYYAMASALPVKISHPAGQGEAESAVVGGSQATLMQQQWRSWWSRSLAAGRQRQGSRRPCRPSPPLHWHLPATMRVQIQIPFASTLAALTMQHSHLFTGTCGYRLKSLLRAHWQQSQCSIPTSPLTPPSNWTGTDLDLFSEYTGSNHDAASPPHHCLLQTTGPEDVLFWLHPLYRSYPHLLPWVILNKSRSRIVVGTHPQPRRCIWPLASCLPRLSDAASDFVLRSALCTT